MPKPVKLKVCCIASMEEARLAIEAGADALGLVAHMPSGPGPIPDDLIRDIALATPPHIDTFLLSSETHPDAVVEHVSRTGTNTVQLVDERVSPRVYAALRRHTPQVKIVQVIHVQGSQALPRALAVAPLVDALLLDSGKPHAAINTLGGTGTTHDWSVSHNIVALSTRPVFLAGGLRASNIADALKRVQPHGVDLCSGVRTEGHLDPSKLAAFVKALRGPTPL